MENMEMRSLFGGIYNGKRVLVTGHTGFKGSWLLAWLRKMGAEVCGIALDPPTDPSHISLLGRDYREAILDITDGEVLKKAIQDFSPEIIFHLAAQALVRESYQNPYQTYLTNVMGTVNVLESARFLKELKAVVIVTSDKCYDNREWVWGYRENDPMGGKDPYSSSKGCAELVTAAYRHSWFPPDRYGDTHRVLMASARAGNVIGGGDWASDRIIPDIVRAVTAEKKLFLRFPGATRPWQHVLEPLSGYLLLGWRLLEGKKEMAAGWNFGPGMQNNVTVLELVNAAAETWPSLQYEVSPGDHPHEAGYLMLDSAKAMKLLAWEPVWDFDETIGRTIRWYQDYYLHQQVRTFSDLGKYVEAAANKKLVWARQ